MRPSQGTSMVFIEENGSVMQVPVNGVPVNGGPTNGVSVNGVPVNGVSPRLMASKKKMHAVSNTVTPDLSQKLIIFKE